MKTTTTISHKQFYEVMNISSAVIFDVLIEEEKSNATLIPFSLNGRNGSTQFEEELLKPAIRKNESVITERIKEKLEISGLPFSLIFLDAGGNQSEADVRSFDDMSMIFADVNGKEYFYPINIKITNGNSADNVGGWMAMDFAIFGNPDTNSNIPVMRKVATLKSTFMKKMIEGTMSSDMSDYFLFVFKKLPTFLEILESAKVFSLLSVEPESFNINMSQSLPIQFNSDAAIKIPSDSDTSLLQRRENLMNMLLAEMNKKLSKELQTINDAQKAINKNEDS